MPAQVHKPFKGGKGKSSLKRKGRNVDVKKKGTLLRVHSKADRRNAAKLLQSSKRQLLIDQNRMHEKTPKTIVVVPLTCSTNAFEFVEEWKKVLFQGTILPETRDFVYVSKAFKNTLHVIPCPRDLFSILEFSLVADYILLLISESDDMDSWTDQLQSALKTQGVPHLLPILISDGSSSKAYKQYFSDHYQITKVFEFQDEFQQKELLRHLCCTHLKGIHWRDQRPYLVSESMSYKDNTLIIEGYVKGKSFDINKKVHLTNMGDFSLLKLDLDGESVFPFDENDHEDIEDEKSVNEPEELMSESDIEMNEDLDEYKDDLEDYRRLQEQEDKEFPDEVEAPIEGQAYERFKKYRGLKSFHHGTWNVNENLPAAYGNLIQFQNIKLSTQRALEDSSAYGVVGQKVKLYLSNVSFEDYMKLSQRHLPVTLFGLLEYEHEISVLHFSLNRTDYYEASLRSKEHCFVIVGFRRFMANPIYYEQSTANLHKYHKFFHSGENLMSSIYGPVQFGHPPVMFFPQTAVSFQNGSLSFYKDSTFQQGVLMTTGTLQDIRPKKAIIKRITLTGNPFKIHKRSAVIRHMFFNPKDVNFFKSIQLRTKHGRFGHIRESLGTHGYMKCTFDKPIQQNDTICLHLYKRIFPVDQ